MIQNRVRRMVTGAVPAHSTRTSICGTVPTAWRQYNSRRQYRASRRTSVGPTGAAGTNPEDW
eukprot:917804-Rhodomonas_salina.2